MLRVKNKCSVDWNPSLPLYSNRLKQHIDKLEGEYLYLKKQVDSIRTITTSPDHHYTRMIKINEELEALEKGEAIVICPLHLSLTLELDQPLPFIITNDAEDRFASCVFFPGEAARPGFFPGCGFGSPNFIESTPLSEQFVASLPSWLENICKGVTKYTGLRVELVGIIDEVPDYLNMWIYLNEDIDSSTKFLTSLVRKMNVWARRKATASSYR